MKKMLSEVAVSLYAEYGDDISDLHIIFPGKRARLFFNESLLSVTDGRPMWQPHYLSIDDLVRRLSPLEMGDHLRLVAELYKIYNTYHPEAFDRFFHWGEMLLSDFDTIDKYLIDAKALYANVSDLRDIEVLFSDLFSSDDESMELVRGFWQTLNRKATQSIEQQQFLKIWRSLFDIYTAYKSRLRELGIGYGGLIYRDIAESLDPDTPDERFEGKMFCFVGFNALNRCEERLFDYLKEIGSGKFYWDYDNYYYKSDDQEAGRFIRRNVAQFGDDASGFEHNNFANAKQIEVISTPSDVLQCKALYRELERLHEQQGFLGKETAIVLTDENLLLPVLHSIPPVVESLNITMGYPLTNTVPYVLLERLLMLQSHARDGQFSHTDVLGVLSHPYVVERCAVASKAIIDRINTWQTVWVSPSFFEDDELLKRIFSPMVGVVKMQSYIEDILSGFGAVVSDTKEAKERKEFIFIILENVTRLNSTVHECGIELPLGIYISLLRQALLKCRVPYEGEPLSGLQIMGILETRNLDFKNVILLSLTDDTFPGNREGNSYVPFNLRQAFGLPTPQDHEAMYAYYFYRLISRCERLTMMYSSASDDKRTGEQSRYIYQLEYESAHSVERAGINLQIDYRPVEPIIVPKSTDVMERMRGMEFYPSKINRYIDCPLKFYFADIERLKTTEQIEQDVSHLDVGNTLHRSMELLYTPIVGRADAAKHIAAITKAQVIEATEAAMSEVMGARGQNIELSGRIQMHRDIVMRYVGNIMRFDSRPDEQSFVVHALERKIKHSFTIGDRQVTIAGVADRIDLCYDGTMRIVDYKSGGDKAEFPAIENLFTEEKVTRDGELSYESHNSAILQTLLYGLVFEAEERTDVSLALYVARKMGAVDFSVFPTYKNEAKELVSIERLLPEHKALLTQGLERLLSELFDSSVAFKQTEYNVKCQYCDFRAICRK